MDNEEYQDLPCVSSHWLKAMLESPADCWRKYLDPQRPTQQKTEALRLGTLVHCLALTPRQFEREFLVADYERRSSAGITWLLSGWKLSCGPYRLVGITLR